MVENSNRQGQVEPQRLGVVERVKQGGDDWRAGPRAQLERHADELRMLGEERVRCAGITPTRRALWRMYIERERHGELHA